MADPKFLHGIATNVSMISSAVGSSYTSHTFTFRVDNKPVKFCGVLSLSEGDEVKVAGFDYRGELLGNVLINITTGVIYSDKNKGGGTAIVCFGVFICLFIVTIPLGILLIWVGMVYGKQINQNEKFLERFNVEPSILDDTVFAKITRKKKVSKQKNIAKRISVVIIVLTIALGVKFADTVIKSFNPQPTSKEFPYQQKIKQQQRLGTDLYTSPKKRSMRNEFQFP